MCLCLWVFYKYGKWRRESGLALRLLLLLARRENILAKQYIYFFKPPFPAPPAVLYFCRIFFLCSLSEVLLGLAVCSSLLPIYLVWFPTYDLAAVCATEREKQCLIC